MDFATSFAKFGPLCHRKPPDVLSTGAGCALFAFERPLPAPTSRLRSETEADISAQTGLPTSATSPRHRVDHSSRRLSPAWTRRSGGNGPISSSPQMDTRRSRRLAHLRPPGAAAHSARAFRPGRNPTPRYPRWPTPRVVSPASAASQLAAPPTRRRSLRIARASITRFSMRWPGQACPR